MNYHLIGEEAARTPQSGFQNKGLGENAEQLT